MAKSCPICCAEFNKALRSVVTCNISSCSFTCCKECVRTYLTGVTADPHCMNCRNKWSLEFTKNALNAAFMDKDYKAHRRVILADREIAKTQEYYEGALRYGKKTEGDQKIAEIRREIAANDEKNRMLYRQIDEIRQTMDSKQQTAEAARKFVMQCQNNGCRGMLTTQYKCDLCTKFTCTKCFVCIAEGTKEEHQCKPEDVATVEELRKNTRPCPSCGARISKIDGCDQMWCIECKTAFSWSKGTVETGTVHNPHYYQWMREHGGGMPPTPGNNNCVDRDFNNAVRQMGTRMTAIDQLLENYERFIHYVRNDGAQNTNETMLAANFKSLLDVLEPARKEVSRAFKRISAYHRFIVHMEHTVLQPLQRVLRGREMTKTHIYEYILNTIGKEELADELIRNDGQNMKDRAECDILEALVAVGKQIMTECHRDILAEFANYPDLISVYEIHFRGVFHSSRMFRGAFANKYNIVCPPEMLTSLLAVVGQILTKYLNAAEKYSAYSNIEYIKMLMVYSSKKGITMWDHREGASIHRQFATKAEMKEHIAEFREFYERSSTSSSSASAASSSSSASSASAAADY